MEAIRALQLGNYDFAVITETKIVNDIYCKNRLGYDCICSQAVATNGGGAKWGIGLIVRDNPKGWTVESLRGEISQPEVSLEDGLWSVLIGEAAEKSAATGQVQQLSR